MRTIIIPAALVLAFAVWTLMSGGGPAMAQGGDIPLIDAHSQVDCHVAEDTVIQQLERLRIRRVLLSIRGCQGWSSAELEERSLEWAAKHPQRISALLSTKVDGWADPGRDDDYIRAFTKRARRDGFVGMGEVLVQHAAHDHPQLKFPKLSLTLDDRCIQAVIAHARAKGWPVILHLELNDDEEASARTLADLEALLATYRDTHFGLIHMGQASPEEARHLIENHPNIFFLTSTADDLAALSTVKGQEKGHVAQTGWVNLFEGQCAIRDCPSAWQPDWRALVTAYPDRFVLAFDNVFPNHWDKPYAAKVGIWRRALAMLPRDVAVRVACANAVRLWSLQTSCE